MAIPDLELVHTVPGRLYFPNTSRSDLSFHWGADVDERRILVRHQTLCDEGQNYPPEVTVVAELPELLPVTAGTPAEGVRQLEAALAERHAAHPWANQLVSSRVRVEASLQAGAPPLEVIRVAARWGCVAGMLRAFGAVLLAAIEPESTIDVAEFRRLATAGLMLRLLQLRAWDQRGLTLCDYETVLADGVPLPKPRSEVRDAIDRGLDEGLAYDACYVAYLKVASKLFAHALAKLEAGQPAPIVVQPARGSSVETARAKLSTANAEVASLAGTFGPTWSPVELVPHLAYKPLAEVGPLLASLLSGRPTLRMPDGTSLDIPTVSPDEDKILELLAAVATLELPSPPCAART